MIPWHAHTHTHTHTHTYTHTHTNLMMGYVKGTQKSPQRLKLEQFKQQNKVVLGYNPKYKINIHKSILILIID